MNVDESELDERLRAWAAAQRASAPEVRVGSEPAAARRPPIAPMLAAAAAVLVVAGGITAVDLTHRHSSAPGAAQTSRSRPPNSGSAVPAGDARVVFHGLAVDVPTAWVHGEIACGTPVTNAVILPVIVASCLHPRPAGVTSVEFRAAGGYQQPITDGRTTSRSVDGYRATETAGTMGESLHAVRLVVPDLDASMTILSPSQAEADRLLATVQVVSVDSSGCPAQSDAVATLPTGQPPSRPGAAELLVPGQPTRIAVCRYMGGLVEQSAVLSDAAARVLVSVLDALPPGVSVADPTTYLPSLCATAGAKSRTGGDEMDREAYLVRADYPSGPSVTVVIRLGLCGDLGASNGTRTGQRADTLLQAMFDAAGNASGAPGKVEPKR
jgi:hypothetical protein